MRTRPQMIFRTGILTLVLLAAFLSCSGPGDRGSEPGTSYYIRVDGDDSNSGKSPREAWRSIAKVNMTDFSPGDRILFRGGDSFQGTLSLVAEDSGEPGARLLLSSFGEGKALIQGKEKEALVADSCQYMTVEHLIFEGMGRKSGNRTDGVLIIDCDSVRIHDSEIFGFQHSGLHLHRCDHAVITHVYARENGFAGIHVSGTTMRDPDQYDNHNLYIGYCVAENNPGDPTVLKNHSGNGILASSVKGGLIEYCEAFNNGWDMPWTGNGPVGLWIWDCTGVTIQYCIAHHNRTNPVAADGGGFDFDGGVSNSVIQYCISHNNEGAGFGLYEFGAAKTWENNTLRYNISLDDGIINGGSIGIWKNEDRGTMRDCQLYNNTFYNSREDGANIWLYDHYPGFEFRNNVFVYNGAMMKEGKSIENEVFQGNLYWNLTGDPSFQGYQSLEEWSNARKQEVLNNEFCGRYADPLFKNPGAFELTDPEKINPVSLKGFFPGTGSPLVDGGLDLAALLGLDPGKSDILGTAIPAGRTYDIGAIEYNHE